MYRAAGQTNFLEILNMAFQKINIAKKRDVYSWQFPHKHVS